MVRFGSQGRAGGEAVLIGACRLAKVDHSFVSVAVGPSVYVSSPIDIASVSKSTFDMGHCDLYVSEKQIPQPNPWMPQLLFGSAAAATYFSLNSLNSILNLISRHTSLLGRFPQ